MNLHTFSGHRLRASLASILILGFRLLAQNEPGLIAHWRFASDRQMGDEIKPVFGGPDVTFSGPVRFVTDPLPVRVELDGRGTELIVAPDLSKMLLPPRDLSAEVWARVDRTTPWGGLLGVVQDNGDFERGWVLGFRDTAFSFGLASEKTHRLHYLTASQPFATNRWHHVVGTYDGTNQCLYVDGELAATATTESGPVAYPPSGPVTIGSYKDKDEDYRLTGAIHEVRLFRRALTAQEIHERYEQRKLEFPEPKPPAKLLSPSYGPFVDWRDRNTAVVTWETEEAIPSRIDLEFPEGRTVTLGSAEPRRKHSLEFTQLKANREYHYRIIAPTEAGLPVQSKRYLFDTSFYYEPPPIPAVAAQVSAEDPRYALLAAQLLKESGIRDGYCLVLGAVDGRLALELVRQSRLDVVMVESDAARIAAARGTLSRAGVYGVRASVQRQGSSALPYGDRIANLIVSESAIVSGEPPSVSATEVARVLRPVGGTVLLGTPATGFGRAGNRSRWEAWASGSGLAPVEVTTTASEGVWLRSTRDRLPGAGDWSHQYGSADNSSCSQDELVRGELQVAWWGDPGPRPMPDRGNRNPAPVSVNGRLFVQGNRILFGIDAYNGSILWTLSAPEVRRANVTRDCSNMAAAGDSLYLAHGRYCLALDGQTGTRARRLEVVDDTSPGRYEWGYVAASTNWVIGSRQLKDAAYLGDDGEWYEDFATEQTSRVTSDRLFSYDATSGQLQWTYRRGAILNSTITIADGMVLFLESQNPAALATNTSRLPHELLTDQRLVALDLRTGRELWQKQHDFSACQYMTYLVYGQNTAVITGTDKDKNYHTYAFAAPSPEQKGGDNLEGAVPGRLLWSDQHKEDKGHHSGHLQHPLVIGSSFYSDQRSFDLVSGKLLRTDLPERRGCGVMSASKNAVFFRHHYHAMWDLETNQRTQFQGIRTGCWLGLIPAGGMLLAPESSAGCSCTHAIQTSVGYQPRSRPSK